MNTVPVRWFTILSLTFAQLLVGCGTAPDDEVPPGPSEYACNSDSCRNGCCFQNVCYPGKSANACGNRGAQCEACLGLATCSTNQECFEDLSAYWDVQIVSAQIASLDPDGGSAWDADNSPPDIVVTLGCPSASGTELIEVATPEVESYSPTWTNVRCSTRIDALLDRPLQIRVDDVDVFFDDNIATFSHQLTEADFTQGVVVFPSQGGLNSLILQLTRTQL
ncbi:hypothetical protein [Comamonas sp. JC664]|uniref:hypothetical protein n=1 Tax=Comamonas sp. JC664 TaxID=2801917 RepID=UPI00188A2CB5|nr:hypothetical protein [Comamonas sp. JC664]MBL0696728.1 hypothetical protein [Comamonas sp. JC664]GHH02967.1 hypothetical protein GCM10012319_71530 [Comamonas sp. KCTC 72670]